MEGELKLQISVECPERDFTQAIRYKHDKVRREIWAIFKENQNNRAHVNESLICTEENKLELFLAS